MTEDTEIDVYRDIGGALCVICEDVDGHGYIMDEYGEFQIEEPESHWLLRFNSEGNIVGALDPVTKDFIPITDSKEIAHWNRWFDDWKKRNKNVIKSYKF
jgi:hypothetical protein